MPFSDDSRSLSLYNIPAATPPQLNAPRFTVPPQLGGIPLTGYNGRKAGNTKGFSGNMVRKLQGHKKGQRALELRKEGYT